ncbi:MAG: WD40 repeat domain-containing protein [Christensenellales bacterium]
MRESPTGSRCLACILVLACLFSVWCLPARAQQALPPTAPQLQALSGGNIHLLTQVFQIGKGSPHEVFWSPDGSIVALASGTGIHLFDGSTLAPLALLPAVNVRLAAWSADGSLLAFSASPGDTLQLWDVLERRMLFSIAPKGTLSALRINQEKGELTALWQQEAGAGKYNVTLYKSILETYQLKNGRKRASVSFQAGDKQLLNLSLLPGGKTIFGAGIKEYGIWDFKGKLLYKAPVSMPMGALGVSDGSLAAVLDMMKPKQIRIIDVKKKAEAGTITLSAGAGRISLDESGRKLQVYTSDSYQVFDLNTLQQETLVPYKAYLTGDLRISQDLTRALVIQGGTLKLIRLETGETLGLQDGFSQRTWQAAAGGDRLAAYSGDPWAGRVNLLLWDRESLQEISHAALSYAKSLADGLFFTPEGSRLISFAQDGRALKYWKASDGTPEGEMALDGPQSSACISADGRVLAAGLGSDLQAWPAVGGTPLLSMPMDGTISSLSLSDDGSRVAAGGSYGLDVLDLQAKKKLLSIINAVLSSAGERAGSPLLHPKGLFVAVLFSGKKGSTVRLLSANNGKTLWSSSLGSHFDMMRFSPDGSILAVSDAMAGLVFLDAYKGKPLFTLAYWPGDFSFSSDGRLIVTASSDGTLRGWGVQ